MAVVQSAHAYAAHMHFREPNMTRVAAQADFGPGLARDYRKCIELAKQKSHHEASVLE
jgi:hypothetical protein